MPKTALGPKRSLSNTKIRSGSQKNVKKLPEPDDDQKKTRSRQRLAKLQDIEDGKTTKPRRLGERRVPTFPLVERKKWQHPLVGVLGGSTLVRRGGEEEDVHTVAEKCDREEGVIGVYVSAHWCPPCRMFTPMLLMAYDQVRQTGGNLQVVFISCDRCEESYNSYLRHMPWLAVPWGEQQRLEQIRTHFNITGIPTLLFLDTFTGEVVSRNGVDIVKADPRGKWFPWRDVPEDQLEQSGFAAILDNRQLGLQLSLSRLSFSREDVVKEAKEVKEVKEERHPEIIIAESTSELSDSPKEELTFVTPSQDALEKPLILVTTGSGNTIGRSSIISD